jgi:DNA-binding response OmpR family regulator
VLDLMLPELDGWGVIESARRDGIGLPIVVVSARGRAGPRPHDVFVRKLRDKLDRRAPRQTFIQTRYGVGCRFEPEEREPVR